MPGSDQFTAPAGQPVVLLPVRLETRYTADRRALRVRVYPDDIHIDRRDPGLDPAESSAGVAFWEQVWRGEPDQAFAALLRAVRPDRAAWVATALTPVNLAELPAGGPEFPAVLAGRRFPAPVARGLPDRFVGVLYQGTELAGVGVGAPVPTDLVVGPRPGAQLVDAGGGLTLGEGTQWLVDYTAAEQLGMAFAIPLGEHTGPFRLLAYGVRGVDGRAQLESLLAAHRVTSGLEFLAVGTPTNNTEQSRSGWQRRTPSGAPPTTPGPREPANADGPVLSAALGIDPGVLSGAIGADRLGQPLARAAHIALWPATWDTYLDLVVQLKDGVPTLDHQVRGQLRDTFEEVVRGRGPLPAVRIGNQPYGVLPTVATGGDTSVAGPMSGLERVLAKARRTLAAGEPPTAFTNLLDVLGTAPTMLGVRMRAGLPDLDELLARMTIYDPLGDDRPRYSEEMAIRDAVAAEYGLDFGRLGYISFGTLTRPLLLPLVADGDLGDEAFAGQLLSGVDREITTMLQALLEMGRAVAHREGENATGNEPPPLIELLDGDLSAAIARVVDGDTDPDLLRSVADQLASWFKYASAGTLAEYQPFAALRTSLLAEARARGSYELTAAALQAWCRAMYHRSRFEQAVLELVTAPLEERRIAVAEALDCASHRLDAWLTSLATSRLRLLRERTPTGLTLGAYGWVDELPGPGAPAPPKGGYVHAPSLTQATTAGVLRSANLAHRGQAFAVDLSGDRIRTGLQLLDGVRQGQPLGAILGYRIERALQENNVGRYVLSLRRAAPLAAGGLTDGDALDGVTRAGILDGVAVLAMTPEQVQAAIGVRPDNPYLVGPWDATADGPRVNALIDEVRFAYDAAADLMLAESVHQLVVGATARAAAVLDAAGGGALPPPDPEFARTPTLGVPITHRVVVLATGTGLADTAGWASVAPRAQAEPRLERWSRERLGPATAVDVAGGVTLDQALLCALDLVYAAGDPDVLRRLLRLALPALGDAEWAAGFRRLVRRAATLRRLLVTAQPLRPLDLVASGADAVRRVDSDDLRIRVEAALVALRTAADDLSWARFGIDAVDTAHAREVAARRVAAATALAAAAQPDWLAVAAAIFGEEFRLVPALTTGGPDPFAERLGRVNPARSEFSRFLRDAATVRDGVARHAETLLHADAFAAPYRLRVAQFGGAPAGRPRAEDAEHWLGLAFGPDRPPPDAPATVVLVDGMDEMAASTPVAGLLLDEWLEVVPRQQKLTSGVAVHADAPAARPPHAILVAVAPDDGDWTAQTMATTLAQTLDLARLRATTLEFSTLLGWVLPALMFPAFSLAGERVLDLRYLAEHVRDVPLPFVNDSGD